MEDTLLGLGKGETFAIPWAFRGNAANGGKRKAFQA